MVAIDVDVEEPVVGADLLQLRVGVHQRLPVPQPDVVDGAAIVLAATETSDPVPPGMASPRFAGGCTPPG